MTVDREYHFLQTVLANPNIWVHLSRRKRKNNLHNKSDENTRKQVFAKTLQTLRLMGLRHEV